ncbi:MAG: nucleoside triphosphate pyrophosphohydrolase [Gemmatimonadota bacterium]|nr:nucleoside triphosphate pyrophosphohydrolase [Gemmatimonadota bacterium]MDH3427415.1 nucleoside triphosphate pyrophosphohydrolase [Gemmatimonadota bacterium]
MSEEQQISAGDSACQEHLTRESDGDASIGRALALVRFLRDRCAWDAAQTATTLLPYLLEEAHEVADAVRCGNDSELMDELGDLLLNVAFQVVLAEERGAFGPESVVGALEDKMRDRHPHVYGDAAEAPDWESFKADRRSDSEGPADPFEGVSSGLEPLSRAMRIQERAAGSGFDWPHASGAFRKLQEEIGELKPLLDRTDGAVAADAARLQEEAGDVLFAAVNVCRLAGLHPMTALEGATDKFMERFRMLLERARREGIVVEQASLETLDRLWDAIKSEGVAPQDAPRGDPTG